MFCPVSRVSTSKLHDVCLWNQNQSFKIRLLKDSRVLYPALLVFQQGRLSSCGREESFSLVLWDSWWCRGGCHAQGVWAWADADSCLLSPSPLQSRQIQDSSRPDNL